MDKKQLGEKVFSKIEEWCKNRGYALTKSNYPPKEVIGISLRTCFYIKQGKFDISVLDKLPVSITVSYLLH